uniref:AMP-dependent synthetase/ligase domain-containing protein n=1 Tax=Rhodosorus marinus TaxID=101924 RepID=A0A7S2ZC53_9RHOD|mmetsp:Transcript_14026/g.56479  ORF Transcript_14026/g.56479 Transcript_14026/m.56479 type:complete len:527 (+) Transcript_14026:194-1774(+)|eukprot:CAMPEP_0113960356 /NCGR_PEP_ID=MMETSP0011_2-20120614/4665_1 /TAXON_ID=101924 /ORGANISM="Rhodosorus marinus" /LENGTH=526 /DNA_ID=CAMNT_0000971791 /DNA_START=144 /DNA_END=1724 /DNA_ORIENTATION=+ /assembly_acc=CAM_ASM_000156
MGYPVRDENGPDSEWTVFQQLRIVSENSKTRKLSGIRSEHGFQSYEDIRRRVNGMSRSIPPTKPNNAGQLKCVATLLLGGEFPILWMCAVSLLNLTQVPLNVRWSVREMINALEDTRPIALVYDPVYQNIVDAIRSKYGHPIEVVRTDTVAYPEQGSQGSIETTPNGSQTPFGVFFTSGTTGRSKGAILTHQSFFVQGAAKLEHVGYNINTVYLHLVPMFHVGGASSAVAVLMAGGTHVVDDSHTFSADRVMHLINKFKVTAFAAVPTMLRDIVDKVLNTSAKVTSFDSVSTILVGGGALDSQLKTQVLSVFPAAAIIVAYGMTETASSITFTDVTARDHDDSGDVGQPPSHVQLSIVCGKESRNQDQGATGEIATKGPHVMQGYVGRPRESATVLQDGWFLTGDLGSISESGSLILRGRRKDMIKTAGENVYALEVERKLAEHPDVAECTILGLPDARYGEIVVAAVVLRSAGRTGWEEDLRSFLRESLSRYKVPKQIFSMWSLPKNANGKVLKDEIRRSLTAKL